MESANNYLHLQHLLQEHEFVGYNSSLEGHKVSTTHYWNPSIILSDSITHDSYLPDSISTSMIQDMSSCFTQQSTNELLLANIKDETSDSFPKLSEILIHDSPSNIRESAYFLSTKQHPQNSHDHHLGENLSLNIFSSVQQLAGDNLYPINPEDSMSLGSAAAPSRYNTGHVVPSTNFSTSDLWFSLDSTSFNLNLRALDNFSSTYNGGISSSQSSHHNYLGKLSESMFMGQNQIPDGNSSSNSSNNKTSGLESGVKRRKRAAGSFSDSKESHGEAKTYLTRPYKSSCPPLKVRKEKLGDRIAALQKLVAPFGKTDTASVLTEAIGYIQFLHDQVQTLSVPYLKSSCNKSCSTMQAGSSEKDEKEEQKGDLGSRGLCLVPLSCASFFNSYNGGIFTNY